MDTGGGGPAVDAYVCTHPSKRAFDLTRVLSCPLESTGAQRLEMDMRRKRTNTAEREMDIARQFVSPAHVKEQSVSHCFSRRVSHSLAKINSHNE